MSARARGAEGLGGEGAERDPPDPRPLTPHASPALYREYRALKEALGQAGDVGRRGPMQSLPAAAEEEVPRRRYPSLPA